MRNEVAASSEPTVLVTRPAMQAEGLCELLAKAGVHAVRLPVLDIEFLADAPPLSPELASGIQHLESCDLVIFTSVNAVEGLEKAMQLAERSWPEQMPEVAAIGSATAERLESVGIDVGIRPGGPYTSEGLLALPRLHAVNGQRILLVGGVGGRGLIAEALTERDAQVTVLEVYRRLPHPHADGRLGEVLRDEAPDAVIVTSVEGLESLVALAADASEREALFSLGLVTVSPRVARAARQQGFRAGVVVADEASDPALVAAFERWRSSRADTDQQAVVDSSDETPAGLEPADPAPAAAAAPSQPVSRRSGILPALVVLFIAVGAIGWVWQQQQSLLETQRALEQRLERVSGDAEVMVSRQVAEAREALASEVARTNARVDQVTLEQQSQAQLVARADEAAARNRDAQARLGSQMERIERLATAQQVDWVIAESRYLYRVARARLLFNADIDGALAALADAETLLADVGADGLDMRRRVQSATRAILELPTGNRQEMTGELQRLALEATDWPLRVAVEPLVADPVGREHDADLGSLEGWRAAASRTWDRLVHSLSGLVVVRRDLAPPPLLAPSEEWFLRENIRLQLLTARLAVLEADQETFELSLDQAAWWIETYFAGSENADRALGRIATLRETSISLPTLDIDKIELDTDAMGGGS